MTSSSTANDKPRVLLIAELCDPTWSSVALVSWHYFDKLRAVADVHLVTHERGRESILGYGLDPSQVTFLNNDHVRRRIDSIAKVLGHRDGKGWTLATASKSISYYSFEPMVRKHFAKDLKAGRFDLVHRLTPLSPTSASPCTGKWGVPFIVGPLNGGLPWPKEFTDVRSAEREWLSKIRGVSRLLPYWRRTYRKADAVVAGSTDSWDQLESIARDRMVYIPRNGVTCDQFDTHPLPGVEDQTRPMSVLFVGRLVPYKLPDVLMEALEPMLRNGRAELTIVGSGPMEKQLRDMAEKISDKHIHFAGQVPHDEVVEYYRRTDLFASPSIREFGGAVVLEAMSSGVPPVIVNYGGPAEFVTPECGLVIPLGNRDAVRQNLQTQLERAEQNRDELPKLASAARERCEKLFDWRIRAEQLREVYDWVLGRRDTKPDFGMPLKLQPTMESTKTT